MQFIDQKHSGKFISNLTYDVQHITNLLSTAILNLVKDSLTLIGLLVVMFIQNWKLALVSLIMIPLASFASRTLGKRMRKAATEAQEKSGFFTTYLVELFKNHKIAKIFQKEKFRSRLRRLLLQSYRFLSYCYYSPIQNDASAYEFGFCKENFELEFQVK